MDFDDSQNNFNLAIMRNYRKCVAQRPSQVQRPVPGPEFNKDRLKPKSQWGSRVFSLPILNKLEDRSASESEEKQQLHLTQRQLRKLIKQSQDAIKVLKNKKDRKAKRNEQLGEQIDKLKKEIEHAKDKEDWTAFKALLEYRNSMVNQLQVIAREEKECRAQLKELKRELYRLKSDV